MHTVGSSDTSDPVSAEVAVDQRLFLRLLALASAAAIYRQRTELYVAQQAEYVEQGRTIEEMVVGSWDSFEDVARAESRLFATIDDLDALILTQE